MRTVEDLALLLEVDYRKHLVYYLYRIPEHRRYIKFEIKKRSGAGTRHISAPASNLKRIQQRLKVVLQAAYTPKASVHGFMPRRGIVTNAEGHIRKKYILSIDLENFFGSINFGRVRGLFMAKPYGLPAPVATVLAQICCHGNSLPQGAPTSPIISNMICSRLDKQLQDLAKSHGCHYSRYADDISFSTSRRRFPSDLASFEASAGIERVRVGDPLRGLVEANGFAIQGSKSRLLTRSQRQEVTGLVVNEFVNVDRRYVRNIRGLLHAWQCFGHEGLQTYFEAKYAERSRFPGKSMPAVVQVAYGRIQHLGAIRGWDDPVYQRLRDEFNSLSPRKIRASPDPWLVKLNTSCWIIEDEVDVLQGTAFFLKKQGLVTCSHCVGQRPYIYRPSDPTRHFKVRRRISNTAIDLSILELVDEVVGFQELDAQAFASSVQYGDSVTLVGYPDHAPGKELSKKDGQVQSFTTKSAIRRFNISCPIIAGNSGGPVLNRSRRVIGIAVTGSDTLAGAGETEEHGVIPVEALEHLIAGGP